MVAEVLTGTDAQEGWAAAADDADGDRGQARHQVEVGDVVGDDRAGGVGVDLYSRWADKAVSLHEGLLLFLRTDPLPPPFPLFWANVSGGLLLLVVLLANLDRTRRTVVPLVATGFVVAAIAAIGWP